MKEVVECLNCGKEYAFCTATKDEIGWYSQHEDCKSIHAIDISEYLLPDATRVLVHDSWVGIIISHNEEDAAEYEDIKYLVEESSGKKHKLKRSEFSLITQDDSAPVSTYVDGKLVAFKWDFALGQVVKASGLEGANPEDTFVVVDRKFEYEAQWFWLKRVSDGQIWEFVEVGSLVEAKK